MGVQTGGDSAGGAPAGELLHPDRIVEMAAALAAVFLGELEAEETELATSVEEVARKETILFPTGHVWRDLLLDKSPHGLTKFFVLSGERRWG